MPKVSVIIPTYNREKYIVETLESVFAQTFTDFEVIVIDDGSTDHTADILKPYLGRIIYMQKENGGPGSARNVGLKVVKGEYIAFLDSDDLWLANKLDIQVKFMDHHPEAGLVFTDYEVFCEDETGKDIESRKVLIQGDDYSFRRLFQRNFIPTLTVIIRKSCINNVGLFDESKELIVGEDYELWLRIAMRYGIGHIHEITARYREHSNNIVGAGLEKNYAMHLRVINKILARYGEIPHEFNINMSEYYRNFYYCSGRNLYQNGSYQPAVGYLRRALSYKLIAPKVLILYLMSRLRLIGHEQTG
ncbi:MAG: glycosyltransferase [Nitrospirae bacterium]|nr:glycosyltransferase [Nitrospirota bacterium]